LLKVLFKCIQTSYHLISFMIWFNAISIRSSGLFLKQK
jgi:hypothetical protein